MPATTPPDAAPTAPHSTRHSTRPAAPRGARARRVLDAARRLLAALLLGAGAGLVCVPLLARAHGAVYQTSGSGTLGTEDLSAATGPGTAVLLGAVALLALATWARRDHHSPAPLGPLLAPGLLSLGLLDAVALAGAWGVDRAVRASALASPTWQVLDAGVWLLAAGLVVIPSSPTTARPTAGAATSQDGPTQPAASRTGWPQGSRRRPGRTLARAGAGAVLACAAGAAACAWGTGAGVPALLGTGTLTDGAQGVTASPTADGGWQATTGTGTVLGATGSPSGVVVLVDGDDAPLDGASTDSGHPTAWSSRMTVAGLDPATGSPRWQRVLSLRTEEATDLLPDDTRSRQRSPLTGTLLVSPDGEHVALQARTVGTTTTVVVLSTATGEVTRTGTVTGPVRSMVLSDRVLAVQTVPQEGAPVPGGGPTGNGPVHLLPLDGRDGPATIPAWSGGALVLVGATHDHILLADDAELAEDPRARVTSSTTSTLSAVPDGADSADGAASDDDAPQGVSTQAVAVLPGWVLEEVGTQRRLVPAGSTAQGGDGAQGVDVTGRLTTPVLALTPQGPRWTVQVSGTQEGARWQSGTAVVEPGSGTLLAPDGGDAGALREVTVLDEHTVGTRLLEEER